MEDLIATCRAPANAIAPRPIDVKELFTLDVDDSIWDDHGLTDNDDAENLPLWLSDEQVRIGIHGILLRDRCDEQLLRLKHELKALEDWFTEEWEVVTLAIANNKGM